MIPHSEPSVRNEADAGLNDVMARLTYLLDQPLPGLAVQRSMARAGRIPSDYEPNPRGARASAVLLIVTPGRELVFIRRAQDGKRHAGQIAFPGGGREERDADLIATALRETEEEIGVPQTAVTVLGQLTPLYISVTNFSVLPVVGVVELTPGFVCQPQEVDEVIVLPLDGFAAARAELEVVRNGASYQAPCYRFGAVEVWGATAMITAEFLEVWDAATSTNSEPS